MKIFFYRFTGLLAIMLAVITIVLGVAGCATEVGQHTFLTQSRPPKPENHPIDVFTNGVPTRPFDRVAVLDAHCESQGFMTPNLEHDGLPVLIKHARAAGCDAIIEVQERHGENWTFETKVRHFTAVGVAYK